MNHNICNNEIVNIFLSCASIDQDFLVSIFNRHLFEYNCFVLDFLENNKETGGNYYENIGTKNLLNISYKIITLVQEISKMIYNDIYQGVKICTRSLIDAITTLLIISNDYLKDNCNSTLQIRFYDWSQIIQLDEEISRILNVDKINKIDLEQNISNDFVIECKKNIEIDLKLLEDKRSELISKYKDEYKLYFKNSSYKNYGWYLCKKNELILNDNKKNKNNNMITGLQKRIKENAKQIITDESFVFFEILPDNLNKLFQKDCLSILNAYEEYHSFVHMSRNISEELKSPYLYQKYSFEFIFLYNSINLVFSILIKLFIFLNTNTNYNSYIYKNIDYIETYNKVCDLILLNYKKIFKSINN